MVSVHVKVTELYFMTVQHSSHHRGESFRKEFANLGDIRSLVPETVRIMALTATATKFTRCSVSKTLGMVRPVTVAVSPNKPNIKYVVKGNPGTLEETFAPLVEELRRKRTSTDRTIIFCRTYSQCSGVYMFMADRLGREMMEPIGTHYALQQCRLIDMFSACTHSSVKNGILKSFPDCNSTLRVIVAFGMGLDCPNI